MNYPRASILTIGSFRVEPSLGEISSGGTRVRLEPRAMQVLLCLAERPGEVVSVNQLLDAVWKGLAVAPGSVYQTVKALRRALGDRAKTPLYIANVVRRGYRLIAPVTRAGSGSEAVAWAEPSDATLPTPAAERARHKSVAVLPFMDMSAFHDQEHFADGLVEEMLQLLSRVPGLKVIARTSAFQFKGRSEDIRAIGARLGVAYIVEGSVRSSGDHVRVAARLIETRGGSHRWSASYDRGIGDPLRAQREIATALARGLRLELGSVDDPQTQFAAPLHLAFERALGLEPGCARPRSLLDRLHSEYNSGAGQWQRVSRRQGSTH
jgi:TolB-like protein